VKIIRRGVTRTVFLVGRWAVKVPSLRGGMYGKGHRLASFCQGVLSNQSERQWHDYEGWAGQVAPVLHSWLGGIVQVYPRCEPVGGDDYWAREQPDMDPDPGDRKAENYGMLAGRLVRVDYDMR
jgi:hypothetical protein